MTNFQCALMSAGMMKTISHVKLTRNRMLITGEAWFVDRLGKCKKKIVSVIFRGVRHHNDKWQIVTGGLVSEEPLTIPFKGVEGYRY